VSACECSHMSHARTCERKPNFTCGTCGEKLCGQCSRFHDRRIHGNWKPIFEKGEYVAGTAYRSALTSWEIIRGDINSVKRFFVYDLYYPIKNGLKKLIKGKD
jgi:hypothetical protein